MHFLLDLYMYVCMYMYLILLGLLDGRVFANLFLFFLPLFFRYCQGYSTPYTELFLIENVNLDCATSAVDDNDNDSSLRVWQMTSDYDQSIPALSSSHWLFLYKSAPPTTVRVSPLPSSFFVFAFLK